MTAGGRRRRYVPLFHRVAATNALVLVVAVIVTVLVLAPDTLSSSLELDEAVVLAASLAAIVAVNLLLVRRMVAPLAALTALARRVDLSRPERLPDAKPRSEAGELALTFNEMLDRLESERREATGRVLAGQEAERLRIAQELHDQIGQELTAVLLGLARVSARLGEADTTARDQLAEVQEAIRSSLEDLRRIALELRPEALDDLGLVSALAVLCERFQERSGLTVSLELAEGLPHLHGESELVVYRVAQEALTNVARHSGADRACLSLSLRDARVVLSVADEGVGIAPDRPPGTGLRGMRERAGLIGATLDVSPGPDGRGCRVTLTLAAGPSP